MLNRVTIMGRLTRDPELRKTQTDKSVASFSLAVERDYGDHAVDFVECTAWNATADFVNRYFERGRMMIVSGRLQMEKWTDRDGNNRQRLIVVADSVYFGDSKKADRAPEQTFDPIDDDDGEELPF